MNSNVCLKHCTEEESTLKEIPCKLKSSRYKGVVPQHNGRWGAQIYECHRRIWLGTFADEVEAALVYDIAAQRFRGAEAITNFKRLCNSDPDGAAELSFIAAHTKAEIVRMLRNNTYHEELKNCLQKRQLGRDFNAVKSASSNGCAFEFLFKKIVTPSDVGKLNRLVIPKNHAEKHFLIKKDDKISINFQDREGKVWRFTYSYWYSSQSYVMTRGWKMFVKEKGIKDGDVVSFWSASDGSGINQYLIDIVHQSCQVARFVPKSIEERNHMHDQETIRLFGVDICKAQAKRWQECDDERIGEKKKREEAGVTFPQETCKKKNCQRIT